MKRDWWVSIEAVNGGIIEAQSDQYLNSAPIDGYKSNIYFSGKSSRREQEGRITNLRYYFYSNQKYYGSLLLDINPMSGRKGGNSCDVKIRYKVNKDGGNDLSKKGKQGY